MTCRGYDPKAVKLTKPVKAMAAGIFDKQKRDNFLRDFVEVVKNQSRAPRKIEKNS